VPVPGPAIVGPPQNPGPGWSHNCSAPKTPVPGGLTIAQTETGTGDRGPAGDRVLVFLKIRSVTMTDSAPDEDGSAEVSCEEQQNSEGDDDVEEVEASGWDPVPVSNPFCVCPRGTTRTQLGHVLMERRLSRTITHLSKTWSIRIF
jgi:hypothetical protein